MLGRCPRCGKSRPLAVEGPSAPCSSCGYTSLIVSGAPPADGLLEPLWAPALMMCIGVSSIVFAFALLAARVAGATHVTVAVPIAECAQQSCEHP